MSFWYGALGGVFVALGSFASNLGTLFNARERHILGAIAATIFTAVVLGSIGGILAAVFTGSPGDFLTGMSATAFVATYIPNGSRRSDGS